MPRLTRALVLLLAPATLVAQENTADAQRRDSVVPAINASTDPVLRGFRWRSIGPVGQGGRVDDITAVEKDPSTFYVGFATGGVWKTTNNGTSFTPVFDTYSTHSIGDIAIAPSNPDVVYVGTGEANNRQSASFGDGVYKSTDGGKTFSPMGLRETQTIARIVVHPTNPDLVWVAALGRLFGPNAERGVYRSDNGGRTWTRTLTVDANTGATDIVMSPKNPDVLFAATYARRRTSFGFASGGPGGGIWKSTDGGRRWTRLSGNGLPAGSTGRIALDISRSNPNVMYAQIEVAPDKEPMMVAQQGQGGQGGPGGGGGFGGQQNLPPDSSVSGIWRSEDGGQHWQFMSNQNVRPMYFSQLRVDPGNENTVYVGGVSAYKSTDGAKTWTEITNTGHVDHHAIWIDPNNSNHVMYGNDGSVDVSWDAAKTWHSLRTWAVGQPYYASVDMRHPYYVCTGLQDNGSWCGPSSVRSGRSLAQDWYRIGGGDGFYSQVDPTDWTVVYSESQGGNMSRLDLREGTTTNIRPRGTSRGGPGGGGGGFGGGAALPTNIVPAPDTNVRFRFNWNTPIILSPHDASTIYTGANRFFKSRDRGATWSMSADLTKQVDRDAREIMGMKMSMPNCGRQRVGACVLSKNDGVTAYGTIVTIGESRVQPGLIWVGTDDGNVQLSRDGGDTFTEVGKNIPGGTKEYYVSRVEPSGFDAATAYVALDGHRSDDLKPYVFVTRDFGATWAPLAGTLPVTGNVNTVKQDPRNRNLLYVGTEFGFYVSLDEGRTWKPFMTNLPVVRIDDVILHPRENDLVLSTHGRSIWIMDDVTPLQQLTPAVMTQDVTFFEPRNAVAWKQDIRLRRSVTGDHNFEGENAPDGTSIAYYLKTAPAGDVTITIRRVGSADVFRTIAGTKDAGLNQVRWNLCSDPQAVTPGEGFGGFGGGGNPCAPGGFGAGGGGGQGPRRIARPAAPGAYSVTLSVNGKEYTRSVTVLEDVWMQ